MEMYDIVAAGCNADEKTTTLLGYKKIFASGKDFRMSDLDEGAGKAGDAAMFTGSDENGLAARAKYGKFILPKRIGVGRSLLARIKDNDAVLCLPMERITSTYGLVRSKNIYFMRKTFSEARRFGAKVSLASMAPSAQFMLSTGQLLELGKMITGNESYVRESIGVVNRSISGV